MAAHRLTDSTTLEVRPRTVPVRSSKGGHSGVVLSGWTLVVLVAALQPAFRASPAMAREGKAILESASRAAEPVFAMLRTGFPTIFALAGLAIGGSYVCLHFLFSAAPRGTAVAPPDRALGLRLGGWRVLAVVFGAHLVAALAVYLTVGGTTQFYIWNGAAVAVGLSVAARRRRCDPAGAGAPQRWGSFILASLSVTVAGVGLVIAAASLDTLLIAATRVPVLPEIWYPIAVNWIAIDGAVTRFAAMFVMVAVSTIAALVCLERASRGWQMGILKRTAILGPAYILVLGPTNPLKGLAVTLVLARYEAVGAGAAWRVGFLVLVVGGQVGMVVA